jgi:hypothetical protein
MSDDASDLLVSGALLAGAGVVGFFGARWFFGARTEVAAPAAAAAPPRTQPSLPATTAPPARSAPARPAPARPAPARPAPSRPAPSRPAPSRPAPSRPASTGPVTSPDQVADEPGPMSSPTRANPAPAAPSSDRLPRTFDPIFERYRGHIPIEYLRALAMQESGMNPRASSGPAHGLLQITEVVRADFNRAHGTTITRAQLFDPDANVRIATWLVRFIVDSYHRHHADVPNMRPDWSNPRFAELVTFGWGAGPSEAGGVGRVVGYLERKGAREIDLDLVHEHARAAGAHAHLSNPAKARWSRGVVALYQRERGAQPVTSATPVA